MFELIFLSFNALKIPNIVSNTIKITKTLIPTLFEIILKNCITNSPPFILINSLYNYFLNLTMFRFISSPLIVNSVSFNKTPPLICVNVSLPLHLKPVLKFSQVTKS